MKDFQLELFRGWTVRERVSERARRVRVDVTLGGDVVLTIPRRGSRDAARRFLEQSVPWIERARARLLWRPVPAPRQVLRWDGSDRIPLRGAPVPLMVEGFAGRRPEASVGADGVRLRVPAAWRWDSSRLTRLLRSALREAARRDAVTLLEEESARLGLRYRALAIRDARSRWGSCGADGRIMLSLRLVLAPPDVFRYVVIHELCHLRWRGHGARFWGLVARQMPDHERHRRWLSRHGAALHAMPL